MCKDIHFSLTGDSKLATGVNVSLNGFLSPLKPVHSVESWDRHQLSDDPELD